MSIRAGSGYVLLLIAAVLLAANLIHADTRSLDGWGNNLANPTWGQAGRAFTRLDPHVYYADSISAPAGPLRPNPRDISNRVGNQTGPMLDAAGRSNFVWQWGQFIDHDITLTPTLSTEPMPVIVNNPADPLYSVNGIPFDRSAYDPATGTSVGNPRQQVNGITAYLDGSMVYGSDAGRSSELRSMQGGRMRTSAGDLLPRNINRLPNANGGPEPDDTLFLAGDIRANEQVGLTSMHTLFVREHNYWADQLAASHPAWSDEQTFQHARKLVGGIVQSITYQEFLPALLGSAAPDMQSAQYDPTVNATIANEFATAAFRLGHTMVSREILRVTDSGQPAPGGPLMLEDAFFRPSFITSDEIDFLLKGLATGRQQRTDVHMIDSLRNAMFGPPGSGGLDLFALNIQRGRDHGLPTLTEFQTDMGLPVTSSFSQLTSDPDTYAALSSAYANIADVDLWVGLLAEDPLPDAAVGSTLAALLAGQFEQTMVGDRFFFQWDEDLSVAEVAMISQTRLSDVILRNSDLTNLQGNVFFVPEPTWAAAIICFASLAFRRTKTPGSQRSAVSRSDGYLDRESEFGTLFG